MQLNLAIVGEELKNMKAQGLEKVQKYRKRYSDIEAVQWSGSNIQTIIDWIFHYYPGVRIKETGGHLYIRIGDTCNLFLNNTDYLIRHATGFFTVMSAWDFSHIYGSIEEK